MWVDGRKCWLAGSAPPQGTQRTSILLGMFLDFSFRNGESGNNQDRMPVIVLAWWQHTAVLALFLYFSEREDSGRWAACWQSAECPRSDFRTCPWSAPQSYESSSLPCQPLMLVLEAAVLREMSRWSICGCSDGCKHVSHHARALSCPGTPVRACGRPLELRAGSLSAHLSRYSMP